MTHQATSQSPGWPEDAGPEDPSRPPEPLWYEQMGSGAELAQPTKPRRFLGRGGRPKEHSTSTSRRGWLSRRRIAIVAVVVLLVVAGGITWAKTRSASPATAAAA